MRFPDRFGVGVLLEAVWTSHRHGRKVGIQLELGRRGTELELTLLLCGEGLTAARGKEGQQRKQRA